MSSANTTNNGKKFKVIVIGDANVGKTSLTYRFCEGIPLENALATIGVDLRSKTLEIDGEQITLLLWDTAGQERYRQSMVQQYYRDADAVIFVYDVTTPSSFTSLQHWILECSTHISIDSYTPCILVGNKCDGVQAVSTNEALILADQYNMPLFETSSRCPVQDNVEAIFITLAHKLKNRKPFMNPSRQILDDTPTPNEDSGCSC